MRLLFFSGIFTIFVTINSQAVPLLSKDERKQSQQFVVDLARNFSSFYFQKMTVFNAYDQIVSPLSVFIPMSILAYGARGQTRKTFLNAIGLPQNKTRMAKVGYEKFLDKLAKYDVNIKTKIFVPPGVELKSYFVDLSKKVFNTEIEAVNVTDGFMDSGKINEWVAAQTHNNVTELFKPQHIGRDPSIVLVNTVYFKGTWKKAFDSSRTAPRPFYPFNGVQSVNVPTMYAAGRFQYGQMDEFNATFIELPYKSNSEDEAMSMFIILPDDKKYDKWIWLVYELRNMNLNRLLNSTEKDVEIYLPKFKIETELTLNSVIDEILKPDLSLAENHVNSAPSVAEVRAQLNAKINIASDNKNIKTKVDRPEPANFSGIYKSSRQSNLSATAMKIVIEVDEEGQQTSESSGISYNTTESVPGNRETRSTIPDVVQFKVDRPFIAIIATKGKILTDIFSINFCGKGFIPKGVNVWW